MFRNTKGVYGYINQKRKIEAIITAILFTIVFILFMIGFLATHTRSNIMTVMAAVSTLPAGKKAVDLLISLRYKTFEKDIYDRLIEHQGNLECAYDMVISSYEGHMPLNAVAIAGNTIVGYTSIEKVDVQKLTAHLKNILENNNCKKANVKIYQKLDSYLSRLDEMNQKLIPGEKTSSHLDAFGNPEPTKEEYIKSVILAISI